MAKVIFSSVLYSDTFLLDPSITLCSQLKIFGSSANFSIRSQLPGQGPSNRKTPAIASPRCENENLAFGVSCSQLLIHEAFPLSQATFIALTAVMVEKLSWTLRMWYKFNPLLHDINWLFQRMWMCYKRWFFFCKPCRCPVPGVSDLPNASLGVHIYLCLVVFSTPLPSAGQTDWARALKFDSSETRVEFALSCLLGTNTVNYPYNYICISLQVSGQWHLPSLLISQCTCLFQKLCWWHFYLRSSSDPFHKKEEFGVEASIPMPSADTWGAHLLTHQGFISPRTSFMLPTWRPQWVPGRLSVSAMFFTCIFMPLANCSAKSFSGVLWFYICRCLCYILSSSFRCNFLLATFFFVPNNCPHSAT